MIKKDFEIIILILLLISNSIFAGVNPKNGNFYISYTDIDLENNKSAFPEIVRTYNSSASGVGYFGYGWSSNIETKLYAYPDGTLLIKERGLGASSYYKSDLALDFMLDDMIDQLIELAISEGNLENSPDLILQHRDKLTNNLEYRLGQWDTYVKKGLLDYVKDFPVGMQWLSHQYGNSILSRTEQGYKREQSKQTEEFNLNGLMIRYEKSSGASSVIEYVDNKISKIINTDGSILLFNTNEKGFVTEITFNDKKAFYKYKETDLAETSDIIGNVFTHTYDLKHNMISIGYVDGSKRIMTYYGRNSRIKSETDREGNKTEYDYVVFYKDDGTIDPDHFATTISHQDYDGKQTTTYEYVMDVKDNGERYTKMYKITTNGVSFETHYDELCDKPILKKRGEAQTIFKYNNRCLLTQKLNASDSVYLKYHPDFDKLIYVKNNAGITSFKYNKNQLLTEIIKNKIDRINLKYNEKGEIVSIILNGKIFNFTYNTQGRWNTVEIPKTGSIKILYDENNEFISNNYSKKEHKIFSRAMQAFSALIDFVKPAGVDYNM
ncbi:DUF6531 domain-containing protein [Seonamhaeicola maritimus]|uniref:DUF6531 domain-containing protein n=1 Tax=Seonamhaeicola maritimus TaxID=2591822 RepID=UPI00249430DE|nr:DUF6531 domain-containing protein [Seonamhaeicola maritimus]